MSQIERQLVPLDFANNAALNFVFQSLFEDPIIAVEGKVYYNNFTKVPKYYDGAEWIPMAGRPIQIYYSDQATMLAAQATHLKKYIYYRSDQNIYYEYLGTILGTMADYRAFGGSGIVQGDSNYLTKYNSPNGLIKSQIFDNGTFVGINIAVPLSHIHSKGNLSSSLSGTVAVTNLSTAVTGVGTLFTSELKIGDSIKIGTEIFTVSAIVSNTSLTLDSAYQGATSSGLSSFRDPDLFRIDNGDGVNKILVNKSGDLTANAFIKSGGLSTQFLKADGSVDSTIYESAFTKGSLIQGAAMTLTGTLTSRLVGVGDITINHADTSTQDSSTNTAGSIIQNITLDTYGHNTALASINGDDRWARRHVLIDSASTWLYTSEAATFPGIHVGQTTTGSTNFPSTLGGFAIFGGAQTNSVSYFARVFGFFREYDTTNIYVGTANDTGTNNGWALLYTSYNLNLGTLGGEPAFTKGSLIAGTNVTLDGTISNRLVGTGDVTINATVPAGQVPIRQVFAYAASNVFSLSYSDPTAIYVALNGQVLQEGSIYDWTISGTSLTLNPILETGDEISILYYTALPTVTNYGRNIDGGAPDSVYLAIQNVNGGTP